MGTCVMFCNDQTRRFIVCKDDDYKKSRHAIEKRKTVQKQGVGEDTLFCIHYISALLVLFLNCFADPSPKKSDDDSTSENTSPQTRSSFLSKILYSWHTELLWKGYGKTLSANDVWDLDRDMKSDATVREFESNWRYHQSSNDKFIPIERRETCKKFKFAKKIKRISILYPIWKTFGIQLLGAITLKLMFMIMMFLGPSLLRAIISWVTRREEVSWHGYLYAIALLVVGIGQVLFAVGHYHLLIVIGFRIKSALTSIIYKKILRITNGPRKNTSLGNVVNLVMVDVYRVAELSESIVGLVLLPVETFVAVYLIWDLLGQSALAGLAVFILLVPASGIIGTKIRKLLTKQMQYKDQRIKLVDEILAGIKVLKLNAWELDFQKQVERIRANELELLERAMYFDAGCKFVCVCAPSLICFVSLVVYALENEEKPLDAQIAFGSLSLCNILGMTISRLPSLTKCLAESSAAIKRINKFLNLEDLKDLDQIADGFNGNPSEAIVIRNGQFSWCSYQGEPLLRNINVKIKSGDLVAVVGSVGSGKSSLLSAILGDMYKQSGFVGVKGKLAYVPQQSWIQSTTFRDNITFDEPPNQSLYDQVINACALDIDLKILPNGDATEIGEKGITLSGGQKQRISLDRAVYSRADIYLLDDPLAAVDTHVTQHIFKHVIGPTGLLKNQTRIMVSHDLEYIMKVDFIIVLHEGKISECGSFHKLTSQKGHFAELLAAFYKRKETDSSQGQKETGNETENHRVMLETSTISDRKTTLESNMKLKVVKPTLLKEEETQIGRVEWKTYLYYLKAIGPLLMLVSLLTNVSFQGFLLGSNWWLHKWSDDKTIVANDLPHTTKLYQYASVYALFILGQGASLVVLVIASCIGMLRAAKYFHSSLLNAILHWPVSTFDRIPSGRVLSRVTYDVNVLDNSLPRNVNQAMINTALMVPLFFTICYNSPRILWVMIPLLVAAVLFEKLFMATSRQLQRYDSVSRAPICTLIEETFHGAQSIRVYCLTSKFIQSLENMVDSNLKYLYALYMSRQWIIVRLKFVAVLIVFFTALFCVLGRDVMSPGLVGLSISYALQVTVLIFIWLQTYFDVEMDMIALERVRQYEGMEQEAAWQQSNDELLTLQKWPNRGKIIFHDLVARHHKIFKCTLSHISVHIRSGEKIGIVGRTGAGKSSLVSSLFLTMDITGGRILIDDVDISKIGLYALRSRLTIIPQDPILFSGTLRMNLDPTGKLSDQQIWRALELANFKNYISNFDSGLELEVTDGGSNFSLGQKQLVCLTRALLRKSKILVLDEATAAVDYETDELIQATIRKEFENSTVLTIAHRLNTIMDYNRIIVLDEGRIVEVGSPGTLLESNRSIFRSMARSAGLVSN